MLVVTIAFLKLLYIWVFALLRVGAKMPPCPSIRQFSGMSKKLILLTMKTTTWISVMYVSLGPVMLLTTLLSSTPTCQGHKMFGLTIDGLALINCQV